MALTTAQQEANQKDLASGKRPRSREALTAAAASAVNSGDATTDTVIGNIRTRLGQVETALRAFGIIA